MGLARNLKLDNKKRITLGKIADALESVRRGLDDVEKGNIGNIEDDFWSGLED